MTPLDQWLAAATHGLSPESAARVRTEIEQHCESAQEAGEDAVAALGDARAANRAYRRVLLTETEAILAPTIVQPKRPSLLGLPVLALLVWWLGNLRTFRGSWPILLAMFSTVPLAFFYPVTSLERSRNYFYIQAVRLAVVAGLAWWYQGWETAAVLGALCLAMEYPFYRRFELFRKIAAGQTVSPLPGEPALTHIEATWLNTLRKGGSRGENIAVAILFLEIAAVTWWLPASFGPMAVWTALGYLTRRLLPIYTETAARRLRIARWIAMGVAAILPPIYGARIPWAGAAALAMFFYLLDYRGIALRRKLPVEQWPPRLFW
jgi:hypothetical protein